MSDSLLPCRACGAACSVQTFSDPEKGIEAKLWMCSKHRSLGGDCPNETAYLYADAWNERPMTDSLSARLEEHEPCRMCEGRRGVNEAQSEGVYVGLKCPKCYGFGSEWIVDFISDAIGNSMGPDWNTRLGAQYVADMLSELGFAQLLSERSTLIAGMEEARRLLEPFAKMAGPINGEDGRISYLEMIEGPNGTGELYLGSHFGTSAYETMWSDDFRAARAYLTKEPNNAAG